MTPRRLVPLVLLLALVACGGATKRQETLKTTLIAVNQARDVFIKIDSTAQDLILDSSTTKEQYTERIAAYRKAQQLMIGAFSAAYQAIATAAAFGDDTSFLTMTGVIADLMDRFNKYKKAHDQ